MFISTLIATEETCIFFFTFLYFRSIAQHGTNKKTGGWKQIARVPVLNGCDATSSSLLTLSDNNRLRAYL